MNRVLKWSGIVVGLLVVLALGGLGVLYAVTSSSIQQTFEVEVEQLEIPSSQAAVERGEHVVETRGCGDCHGEKGGGETFIDSPVMGTFAGSNLTAGNGGIGDDYTDTDWLRAIRHGVGPEGKPLLFMPSHEFTDIGRKDLAAMVAYLKQLPPVDHQPPEPSPGPMARLLYLKGDLPMLIAAEMIDHQAAIPEAPPKGPTVEYGRYLAASCKGCHGEQFSGGPIPGMPPSIPAAANLTPHETGIKDWSREDWERALTTGETPDGQQMAKKHMPWHVTKAMTETERTALWRFFQSLSPRPQGNR
ncbi:MAG: c-type cytochrome [Bradymonadaceae bacterium]